MTTPTLSGIQFGHVRPWREVEGGIWLYDKNGQLENKPCALRVLKRGLSAACLDYARQYLMGRADSFSLPSQLEDWARFFRMHYALVELPRDAEGQLRPLLDVPTTLVDAKGKLSVNLVPTLPLNDATDGQMERLGREYDLLCATQTPDRGLSIKEWETIIEEGKEQSLRILHLRYGSSRLIQVLHGLREAAYPE